MTPKSNAPLKYIMVGEQTIGHEVVYADEA